MFAATFARGEADRLLRAARGAGPGAGAWRASPTRASTDARIASLQGAVKARHLAPRPVRGARRRLPAEGARDRSTPATTRAPSRRCARRCGRDPRDAGALTAMGSLANARHDFRAGLRFGERARAAAPGVVKPYGVIVDAQVELGRYERGRADAAAHGRPEAEPGLLRARLLLPRAARRPAGRDRGDAAGGLRRRRRAREPRLRADAARQPRACARPRSARRGTRTAWRSPAIPNTPPRRPGSRARPLRAATWPPRSAATERVVERLPLPEYAVALAEAELAAGRRAAAREDLALVRGAAAPAAPRRRERRCRDGGRRGRPRQRRARGAARPAGMGRRAQRARGRCARLGADAGGRARPGPARTRSGRCGSARGTRCSCTTPASRRAMPGAATSRAAT